VPTRGPRRQNSCATACGRRSCAGEFERVGIATGRCDSNRGFLAQRFEHRLQRQASAIPSSYADPRQASRLGPALPQEQVPVLATPRTPVETWTLFLPIMASAARKCDRGRE
jgi:hypothetical protein